MIDEKKFKVNDEIHFKTVRLIYKDNKNNENNFSKIVSIDEAKKIANEYNLDLIEINSKVNPVIVILNDFSKYIWELKKNEKRKKSSNTGLKEIQLTANISDNDLKVKENKAKTFIKENCKIKLVITFRGRENLRKNESSASFLKFIEDVSTFAIPEFKPKSEGNKMMVILKKR